MRFHSRYPLLQFWLASAASAMRPDALAFARIEPTIAQDAMGGALLDLIFVDARSIAVLPFIHVQSAYVIQRERSPLIWPNAARALGNEGLRSLEDLVIPWLESRSLARHDNEDGLREFAGARERAIFGAAQDAGFLGAARYDAVMPALAPYVYAARFSENASAGVSDSAGANGAVLLARAASGVRADLGSGERNELARLWFGSAIFGELEDEYDVVVAPHAAGPRARVARITLDGAGGAHAREVIVAAAVPSDVLVSFDPQDAPATRSFAVDANVQRDIRPNLAAARAQAAGGSSGVIVMLMREDFQRVPDADVDEARELAARLRAEGFTVELLSPSSMSNGMHVDLVHAFGVSDSGVPAVLEKLRAGSIPIVLNAQLSPAPDEAAWGPDIVNAVYQRAPDDGMLDEFFDLIALRKLNTGTQPPAPPLEAALRLADVAIVNSAGEEEHVRTRYGFKGEVVRCSPLAPGPRPAASIASLTGYRKFVLAHAPVQWRTNFPVLARAAVSRGMPMVLAGAAVDIAALRWALQAGPDSVIHVPDPEEAELEALYRSAHVYADVSWAPAGLARVARAAASGCRLALSRASYAHQAFPTASVADPGSISSIGQALDDAWNAPEPSAEPSGPDLFPAAVFAYARAVAVRRPA